MAARSETTDIAKLSFEDALAELEEIVRRLEEGEAGLDAAIASYERGAALKKHCEEKLRQAQAKVEQIVLGTEGPTGKKAADIE